MSGGADALDSLRNAASTGKHYLVRAIYTVLLWGALLAWTGFWAVVVRLHYLKGNLTSAAVTGVLLVGPPLGALAWKAREHVDVGGWRFDADLIPTSN